MTDRLPPLVSLLTEGQTHRVWSVLVTVFGDLAQAPDQWISGTVFSRIAHEIGVKPEATRVALHRLRKDGWIVSRRTGRESVYGLTRWGQTQSASANPVIYGPGPAPDAPLYVVLRESGEPPHDRAVPGGLPDDLVWVTPTTALSARPVAGTGHLSLPTDGAAIPGWMRQKTCAPSLVKASREAEAAFSAVSRALGPDVARSPLATAVLRVLVVHTWRRVALKAPRLADRAFPEPWRGPACRRLTASLLTALPRPDLAALEEAARCPAPDVVAARG